MPLTADDKYSGSNTEFTATISNAIIWKHKTFSGLHEMCMKFRIFKEKMSILA